MAFLDGMMHSQVYKVINLMLECMVDTYDGSSSWRYQGNDEETNHDY